MAIDEESNVRVDLTGKPHFRFQDLAAYKKISGQHVKEMDFCWLRDGKLFMLEVKAYSDEMEQAKEENVTAEQFVKYLVDKTAPKVWDSLLMFSACWLPTNQGTQFRDDLPKAFHTPICPICVVIVLDVPAWLKRQHFATLRTRFRDVLRGKMTLFDSENIIICTPGQLGDFSERLPEVSAMIDDNG
ncbi:MAG: hypothetical protein HQL07_13080 [Nitrospirae bacterium]|nr:hypothetical protein [Magnetococcales bacterium]